MEQNDNHFYGIINNQEQPDPAEVLRQQARESEKADERRSVLETLKAKQDEIWETAKEILARLATIQ